MSVFPARGYGAAFVLVLSSQAALADLSAQEVWDDWKSYLSGTGYDVNGTETLSGGTLTVSDMSMMMPIPDEDVTIGLRLPEIQFSENGDGTVDVLFPKEFPITFNFSGDNDNASGEMIYSHDGSAMLVSGDAQTMTYDYSSPLVELALGKVMADGEEMPAGMVKATISLMDVVTKTSMTIGDLRIYDQSMTASALNYSFGAKEPGGSDAGSATGSLQGLSFGGTSSIPMGLDFNDITAMLASGFAFDGVFSYSGGHASMSAVDGSETFGLETSSQGGNFAIAMGNGQLSYDLKQLQTEVDVSSSDLPFPVSLSIAEYGAKLAMPIAKSDSEQDFALGLTLRDFAVPDMLWGMVDPTGMLSHEPATVVLDLAGKGKLLFDLFDPAAIDALDMGDQEPGELTALTIRQLQVSAAGAKLTGTGDFTFNNDDLASFDGMPAPAGSADLKLVGANALIDTLIQMGLMSDGDAMGARMMMGMLTVPGDGEDTLDSKLEITGDGQILANGQRIK
ncbi:DUF2125 domain-containing protein [Parasedimentitalea psychrophila]|uniref:DUF2125 domain-containing protein n=1 Tax=Parasedimentitalea psychrophila TaxID=2997337 RepID=A0A9Y2P8E1_9RHOB|nr:DUF2125 domain-containing protein [Parasedimentitalea psychrophila]WIY26973.1 DUF2125 domain-containing protein [Parasedimentitalea psychrophila]